MSDQIFVDTKTRRFFLKEVAVYGGAIAVGTHASTLGISRVEAAGADDSSVLIGIQLGAIRDEMTKDPDAALGKLAEIGYKAFAPIGFSGIDPKKYRAMLDSHGLIASNIDSAVSTGPDMEKDLEGCQIMGVKYALSPAEVEEAAGAGGGKRERGRERQVREEARAARDRVRAVAGGRGANRSGERRIREA